MGISPTRQPNATKVENQFTPCTKRKTRDTTRLSTANEQKASNNGSEITKFITVSNHPKKPVATVEILSNNSLISNYGRA